MIKVFSSYCEFFNCIGVELHLATGLHQPIHRRRLGRSHQALDLRTREVFRPLRQILQVDIRGEFVIFAETLIVKLLNTTYSTDRMRAV